MGTDCHDLTVQQALAALSRTKTSGLGGDGRDTPFEEAFSSIVHAYVRDKAPSLLDYEQGFQLLERNQDNTKAVGILAFKVGSQHLFVPAFFLQGELKGHELLYIQEQDLFVPLEENWLNYILNRKPHIIGDGVTRNLTQLGLRRPNLQRLRESPQKYASAYPVWVQGAVAKFAATALLDVSDELEKLSEEVSLPRFLRQAGRDTITCFLETCKTYPKIAEAIDQFHGIDTIATAIRAAIQQTKVAGHTVFDAPIQVDPRFLTGKTVFDAQHPTKTGALKIYTYNPAIDEVAPADLSLEEQSQLAVRNILIKDAREDDEVTLNIKQTAPEILTSPTETGLYDLLVKEGDFEKCFIAYQPHGSHGRARFATVVSLDDNHRWVNAVAAELYVNKDHLRAGLEEWFDGLSGTSELSKDGGPYIAIGRNGDCTLPFTVNSQLSTEDGAKIYDVRFDGYCDQAYRSLHTEGRSLHPHEGDWGEGSRIHLDGKLGTVIRSSRGDVWVPKGFKVISLAAPKSEEDSDAPISCCCSTGQSATPPLRPGNIVDAEVTILQKTAELKVYSDSVSCRINGRRLTPMDGLIHLVRDHGLREKTAREILQTAERSRQKTFRLKYASPYLTDSGPTAPQSMMDDDQSGGNMMGFQGNYQEGQEEFLPIPEMSAANTDREAQRPSTVPDPMAMQGAQQAAGTGSKALFDTHVLSGMLKTVRDDNIIDKYIPDLLKGMDRLGRILFMFYWHMQTFADRYGKQDLTELGDSVRNAFELVGQVTLFLKQKTIEPYPDEARLDLDLSHVADI